MSANAYGRQVALLNRLNLIEEVASHLADNVGNEWHEIAEGIAQVARDGLVDVKALLNPDEAETNPAGGAK